MKRQNLVILTGRVMRCEENAVRPSGDASSELGPPALLAVIETDHPDYGGRHKVIFAGRLALELTAFLRANGREPLEVTVDGWLRSGHDLAAVVVDRAMFHVSGETRSKAALLMKQMLCGGSGSAAPGR